MQLLLFTSVKVRWRGRTQMHTRVKLKKVFDCLLFWPLPVFSLYEIRVKTQAGVRIADSQIQGRGRQRHPRKHRLGGAHGGAGPGGIALIERPAVVTQVAPPQAESRRRTVARTQAKPLTDRLSGLAGTTVHSAGLQERTHRSRADWPREWRPRRSGGMGRGRRRKAGTARDRRSVGTGRNGKEREEDWSRKWLEDTLGAGQEKGPGAGQERGPGAKQERRLGAKQGPGRNLSQNTGRGQNSRQSNAGKIQTQSQREHKPESKPGSLTFNIKKKKLTLIRVV